MVEATTPIPAGEHQVRMEFAYAGGGLGKGRQGHALHRRQEGRRGQVDATLANVFSADDGCDVGEDTGAPVSPDYGRTATRSTAGSRACSSRSPRPRTSRISTTTLAKENRPKAPVRHAQPVRLEWRNLLLLHHDQPDSSTSAPPRPGASVVSAEPLRASPIDGAICCSGS